MSTHCTIYPCQSVNPPDPVQLENGGKKDKLELNDSLTIQGHKITLDKYFSADYYREINPKMRYQHFLEDPQVKYEKKKDGEWITLDGQRMKITEEVKTYVQVEDLRWNMEDLMRKSQRSNAYRPNRIASVPQTMGELIARAKINFR